MKRTGADRLLISLLCLCALAVVFILPDRSEIGKASAFHDNDEQLIGIVVDEDGPVANAIVRIQTTQYHSITEADGSFKLAVSNPGPHELTAWARGYYIAGPVEAEAGRDSVVIELKAHAEKDHTGYQWQASIAAPVEGESKGCIECHSSRGTTLKQLLPVDEWLQDAHSGSARNPRFLSIFMGSDVKGNVGKPTRYMTVKDYGTFPIRDDDRESKVGPGFRLDFPGENGNCSACHAPVASINNPYGTDPAALTGVEKEGVNCDFCHKVWDVRLDPVTGLPAENRPGVMSFEFRRPNEGHQFFAGPLDDVAPGEDTFSPLQRKSQFCAPCHFGVFWETKIYNSFGEWLESPYSHAEMGKTCQDCHMPNGTSSYFVRPDKGGRKRDSQTIFTHYMPGAKDEELLANAVSMNLRAERIDNSIQVTVTITNDKTGHHIPTDSPLRHMILLVTAVDYSGKELEEISGSIIPEWCGVGDPGKGYFAGLPGKAFAKILKEAWTHVQPTAAYWNPTRIVSDNRIAALESDTSTYRFKTDDAAVIKVEAKLLFRRAFKNLMDQKGWDVPDVLMEKEQFVLDAEADSPK